MEHSIEMTSVDDKIPLLPQTEKDEIEQGDHLIDIKDTNGQDPSGSQTKKSLNQIFAKKFKDLDNSSIRSRTIFKVNVGLRESSPASYTPKMVSIGPYHKKDPHVGSMEDYKLLYLKRFLKRKQGLDVESCISKLEKLKEKAIKCYEDIEDLTTDEFCEMLLFDGCFVIEFIREVCQMYQEEEEEAEIINFAGHMYQQVFRDLMLLENQLPFFVLDKLHDMTKQDDELPFLLLANVSFIFFVDLPTMIRESFDETALCNVRDIKHLLHLVHISSCHRQNLKGKSKYTITRLKAMPNATELSEAGVKFVKKPYVNTSLFDITFEKGLMRIPYFEVFDYTETFLRNLIAYEQQSCDVYPTYFSDYATFMDNLIDSDKDVNLLRQKGIIENWMGEDKQVASFFNKIGNGVSVYSNFYYSEEFEKVGEHCEKQWNRNMANLKHNYFSSFWVGASTLAAIILLILTAIQTILAFIGPVKN